MFEAAAIILHLVGIPRPAWDRERHWNARGTSKNVGLIVSLADERAERERRGQSPKSTGGPGRTRTCNQTAMSGPTEFLLTFDAGQSNPGYRLVFGTFARASGKSKTIS